MKNPERGFRFKGQAVGVAGRITAPSCETIDVQASVALPDIGGYGTAEVTSFYDNKYVRFDRARSVVTGTCPAEEGDDDDCCAKYSTLVRCTIEGLNVMDTVTADRVVANIVSEHSGNPGDEPSVKLIGSRFEGLRVAGIACKVDLAVDVFDQYSKYKDLQDAYAPPKSAIRSVIDAPSQQCKNAPGQVKSRLPETKGDGKGLPRLVSLVRSITPEFPVLKIFGHIIHVEGFGSIRLAEVDLRSYTRALTMLRIDLCGPTHGVMMMVSGDDGGGPYG